jgi:hypothetical protein
MAFSMATQTMRADTKAVVGAKADVTPLLGTWVNAKRNTDHIATVVITEQDGAVLIRPYGSSAGELFDWGETEATPYAFTGTTEVAGFHARYAFGVTWVEVAANVKQGILVIQTYTTFHDERLNQFSREFFYQSSVAPGDGEVATGVSFLTGDWVNTNLNTKWLKGFTITADTLRVLGAATPADWGETAINTYLDGAGDPAFLAEYDLGSVEAVLAGNTGKNIIIVAAFIRLKGGEPANSFCREFFVPR